MQAITKLESVNSILSAASESPVSNLDVNAGLQVSMAISILDEVSRETQSYGWYWNRREVTYIPDSLGHINIPSNIIEIDSKVSTNYSIRSGRLFLLTDGTDTFTSSVTLQVKELLEWDDLPQVARQFITLSAARRYCDRTIGTPELARFTRTDELAAWMNLKRYEQSVGDYNMLNAETLRYLNRKSPINYIRTW